MFVRKTKVKDDGNWSQFQQALKFIHVGIELKDYGEQVQINNSKQLYIVKNPNWETEMNQDLNWMA